MYQIFWRFLQKTATPVNQKCLIFGTLKTEFSIQNPSNTELVMQAIIISGLDMWPATITSTPTASSSPPPPTGGGGTQTVVTAANQTPYRPFESPLHELEFRPNPFPSPEPPAPPPAALSPPLQIVGSQWTLSPPDEQRSAPEETVRLMNNYESSP